MSATATKDERPTITREDTLGWLAAFERQHGRPAKPEDLAANAYRGSVAPSLSDTRRLFGSLTAALDAARRAAAPPARRTWTRGEVLLALRQYAADHGRVP